jgi:hypothetical protein
MPDAPGPLQEELDFVNLVLLLGSTANIEMGQKGEKGSQKQPDLPRARQIINMLDVLEKKTQGRRSSQEEKVLSSVLADLKAKYVQSTGLNEVDQNLTHWAARAYGQQMKKG